MVQLHSRDYRGCMTTTTTPSAAVSAADASTAAEAAAGAALPPVAGRDADLGWHLGVLLRAYHATVGDVLADVPHGPRGYQVLVTVAQGDKPTQLALAEHHGIDRTVMTYLVDDLVTAGLVERQQNPADRRARRVVATPEGRRRLSEWAGAVHDAEEQLLEALSPQDRHAFRTLVRRVACDLRDVDAGTDPCTVAEHTLNPAAPTSAGQNAVPPR